MTTGLLNQMALNMFWQINVTYVTLYVSFLFGSHPTTTIFLTLIQIYPGYSTGHSTTTYCIYSISCRLMALPIIIQQFTAVSI